MESVVVKTMRTRGKLLEALRRSPLVGADLEIERESSNGRRSEVTSNDLEAHTRSLHGEFVAEDHLSLPESISRSAVSPEKD